MSSNDGSHGARDDAYRYQHDITRPPQLLQQQQQQPQQQQQHQHLHLADGGISQLQGHQMMWPPNHHSMMPPPPPPPQQFMHQTAAHLSPAAHLAATQQHQQQRQHRYNDFMFNMPAYLQPQGPPETYSVLPVGHGNFLKIYHCNDALNSTGANSPDLGGGSIYAHQQQQTQAAQQQTVHQQQHQQHQQQQQHFQAANTHFNMQQPSALMQQTARQQQQFTHNRGTNNTTMSAVTTPAQQQPKPQQQQPQIFNSYELFSSNPLLPAACDTKLTVSPQPQIQQQQILQPQQRPQKQKQPSPINIQSNDQQCLVNENSEDNTVAVTTTNMIINKLVNNWSPNLTGVAYTQFPVPTPPPAPVAQENIQSIQKNVAYLEKNKQQEQLANTTTKCDDSETMNITDHVEATDEQIDFEPIQHQQIQLTATVPLAKIQTEVITSTPIKPIISATTKIMTTTVVKNNNFMPEVKKQRIVAEVKPMRMTYSDVVLSKVTYAQQQQQQQQQQQNANQTAMMRNGNKPMGTATQMLNNERNKINSNTTTTSTANITTSLNNANKRANEEGRNVNKKSPIHEQKETSIIASPVPITATSTTTINKTKRNNNNNNNGQNKINTNKIVHNNKTTIMNENTTTSNGNNNTLHITVTNKEKKRNNNNAIATKDIGNQNLNKKSLSSTVTTTTTNTANHTTSNSNLEKESAYYERVPRKVSTTTTTTKSASNFNSNNIQANLNGSNNGGTTQSTTTTTSSYTKTRYSSTNNLNNSSSYSYSSTKRQRSSYNSTGGIGSFYGSSTSSSAATYAASNRNYELAKKVLSTWCEYMLKILMWLFYLVYDIVVIGCSMAFDSLKQNALSAWTQLRQFRADLKQNSNKPSLWLRNSWRKFDARFGKNSRWAFWRRFYPKKPPPVTPQENFKSGRLPQTGEEAMYSLLNCKGKNAYSILGVPPDSSQEQIRKHYKKIAVLVHPDKNKQAGAEEAFKVLQRAFELIGEPENRHSYDQSLAEALHAEKAWTEFHDLLSQLHTKITEAANTIRCSTCSLRHPRKITDRPHYAARECASCKIRHSAREGDIWAESSMLGLRWKYLALMEGKVYDITEWANCQKGALSHLEPNSHMVQYRIVRGAQQQQQQQQQQTGNQRQRQQSPDFDSGGVGGFGAGSTAFGGAAQYATDMPASDASLHEFLDNLYSGQNPHQQSGHSNSSRRRSRRN